MANDTNSNNQGNNQNNNNNNSANNQNNPSVNQFMQLLPYMLQSMANPQRAAGYLPSNAYSLYGGNPFVSGNLQATNEARILSPLLAKAEQNDAGQTRERGLNMLSTLLKASGGKGISSPEERAVWGQGIETMAPMLPSMLSSMGMGSQGISNIMSTMFGEQGGRLSYTQDVYRALRPMMGAGGARDIISAQLSGTFNPTTYNPKDHYNISVAGQGRIVQEMARQGILDPRSLSRNGEEAARKATDAWESGEDISRYLGTPEQHREAAQREYENSALKRTLDATSSTKSGFTSGEWGDYNTVAEKIDARINGSALSATLQLSSNVSDEDKQWFKDHSDAPTSEIINYAARARIAFDPEKLGLKNATQEQQHVLAQANSANFNMQNARQKNINNTTANYTVALQERNRDRAAAYKQDAQERNADLQKEASQASDEWYNFMDTMQEKYEDQGIDLSVQDFQPMTGNTEKDLQYIKANAPDFLKRFSGADRKRAQKHIDRLSQALEAKQSSDREVDNTDYQKLAAATTASEDLETDSKALYKFTDNATSLEGFADKSKEEREAISAQLLNRINNSSAALNDKITAQKQLERVTKNAETLNSKINDPKNPGKQITLKEYSQQNSEEATKQRETIQVSRRQDALQAMSDMRQINKDIASAESEMRDLETAEYNGEEINPQYRQQLQAHLDDLFLQKDDTQQYLDENREVVEDIKKEGAAQKLDEKKKAYEEGVSMLMAASGGTLDEEGAMKVIQNMFGNTRDMNEKEMLSAIRSVSDNIKESGISMDQAQSMFSTNAQIAQAFNLEGNSHAKKDMAEASMRAMRRGKNAGLSEADSTKLAATEATAAANMHNNQNFRSAGVINTMLNEVDPEQAQAALDELAQKDPKLAEIVDKTRNGEPLTPEEAARLQEASSSLGDILGVSSQDQQNMAEDPNVASRIGEATKESLLLHEEDKTRFNATTSKFQNLFQDTNGGAGITSDEGKAMAKMFLQDITSTQAILDSDTLSGEEKADQLKEIYLKKADELEKSGHQAAADALREKIATAEQSDNPLAMLSIGRAAVSGAEEDRKQMGVESLNGIETASGDTIESRLADKEIDRMNLEDQETLGVDDLGGMQGLFEELGSEDGTLMEAIEKGTNVKDLDKLLEDPDKWDALVRQAVLQNAKNDPDSLIGQAVAKAGGQLQDWSDALASGDMSEEEMYEETDIIDTEGEYGEAGAKLTKAQAAELYDDKRNDVNEKVEEFAQSAKTKEVEEVKKRQEEAERAKNQQQADQQAAQESAVDPAQAGGAAGAPQRGWGGFAKDWTVGWLGFTSDATKYKKEQQRWQEQAAGAVYAEQGAGGGGTSNGELVAQMQQMNDLLTNGIPVKIINEDPVAVGVKSSNQPGSRR